MLGRSWHGDSCTHAAHMIRNGYGCQDSFPSVPEGAEVLSTQRTDLSLYKWEKTSVTERERRVGGKGRKQQSMLVTKIARINWSHPCGLAFASDNCSWAQLQEIRSTCSTVLGERYISANIPIHDDHNASNYCMHILHFYSSVCFLAVKFPAIVRFSRKERRFHCCFADISTTVFIRMSVYRMRMKTHVEHRDVYTQKLHGTAFLLCGNVKDKDKRQLWQQKEMRKRRVFCPCFYTRKEIQSRVRVAAANQGSDTQTRTHTHIINRHCLRKASVVRQCQSQLQCVSALRLNRPLLQTHTHAGYRIFMYFSAQDFCLLHPVAIQISSKINVNYLIV